MGWKLQLDRQREWPAKRLVDAIEFRDPTLKRMRGLPEIEVVRRFSDGSSTYGTNWDAVDAWLKALVADDVDIGLIDQLSPAEAERAKTEMLGFFGSAAAATPKSAPPTTSASEPVSGSTRID